MHLQLNMISNVSFHFNRAKKIADKKTIHKFFF